MNKCSRSILRSRGFDSRTVQTFVCMNMSVVLGLGVSIYNMCVFTKKVHKYVLIRYLESITQAVSAYFGLDSRECKCLKKNVSCGVRYSSYNIPHS
jgi:hypothetical protein